MEYFASFEHYEGHHAYKTGNFGVRKIIAADTWVGQHNLQGDLKQGLTTASYRKFFSLKDGVEPKKQQSTLAFQSSPKSKKQYQKGGNTMEAEIEVNRDETKDENVEMTNGLKEEAVTPAPEENKDESAQVKAEPFGLGI